MTAATALRRWRIPVSVRLASRDARSGKPSPPARLGDDGSASVLVVCVIAVVGVLAFTAVAVGEVGVSRHRAAAAADLSAIAGALAWPAPRSVVCARAAAVAARNGAVLADCTIDGAAVTVRVVLPVRALGAARADVTARARAAMDGPALLRADRARPRPAMQP